jgi:TfoX/Sxy family transcriptional regulator of competence genes
VAWKKVPAEHHAPFLAALPDDPRSSSMMMFGGIAGMVNGHMYAGLWADTVMVRVDEADQRRVLAMPGANVFDPMGKGKPMKDMVLLPAGVLRKKAELKRWLARALEFTAALPPKPKKKAAKKASRKK